MSDDRQFRVAWRLMWAAQVTVNEVIQLLRAIDS